MKRLAAVVVCLVGVAALVFLLPHFDAAQPRGLEITRSAARSLADAEARKLGIEVDKAWPVVSWEESPILERELAKDPARRREADADPVVGPRLGSYRVTYFRIGEDKYTEYGLVLVGKHGEILGARRRARGEEAGAKPAPEALRPEADAFIASRAFAGAPSPAFDSVRPTVLSSRVDHLFRYRVPSRFRAGEVAFYVGVYFIGDRLAGWELLEEYEGGRPFRFESGANIAGEFLYFGVLFLLLAVFLFRFLKKYHAGEVGVGTGAFLFAAMLALSLILDVLMARSAVLRLGMASLDARATSLSWMGFKVLFFDLPRAVLIFVAWAVGESDARERWGERLASFDALLRSDARNATVGRSVLAGLLSGPAVAAAALLPLLAPLLLGRAHGALGEFSSLALNSDGGPAAVLVNAIGESLWAAVVALLAVLAPFSRRRLLGLGIVASAALGMVLGICAAPVEPELVRLLLGFGGVTATAAVFLFADLLASAVSLFTATLLLGLLPYAAAVSGPVRAQAVPALAVPLALLLGFALLGIASRREVVYRYEDLAPHVKRIVDRERVKAEIDAANRIQAALLPSGDPAVPGTSVASHYRAATEIGGDYFDFLMFEDDQLGLAFGDVSGHGLTSGIVMAMAKSALLVQIGYDASPARVLEVLNQTVMKTAPKRILMTFFFGLLDTQTGTLRYASAGHLDPYVFRAREKRLVPLSAWGFPLGVRRREPFRESEATLAPGDRLVLYSDGLIEALDDDGEPFGFSRFEKVLEEHGHASPHEIKSALLQSIKRFTRGRPPEDDQTLVVLSFDGRRASVAAA